jgi:hypothetical protein
MKTQITKLLSAVLIFTACGLFLSGAASEKLYAAGYMHADFENVMFPPAGWSVANTSGYNWIRTSYTSAYGIGSACALVDFYDIPSGSFDLITNTFPATTSGDSLVFDHAYTCATSENDQLSIYTSTNGGSSWTLLINLPGGASGPLTTAPPTYKLFIPTPSQWATKRYALPAGTNCVKFTAITAFGNNLYFDNVRIGSQFGTDVGANAVFSPKWGITQGSFPITGSVRNYGTSAQTFTVTLTINPGSYTNTQTVTNLAAGQTQLVTFPNFNFNSNGNYTLKAYTTLASDQNHSNDTIASVVTVTPAPRKVILEFCTGTWCQWCACGDAVADTLDERYPDNSVILAYHGGSDPWINFNGNGIIGMMGWTGYPSGVIDRRGGAMGWGSFFSDGEYRLSQSPASSVNIVITSQSYNTTTRQLTVGLDATALSTLSGQYYITYVITEDNLVYAQTGNSWCPGSSNWVHKWVTRNIVNGATGETVNSGTWNQNQTYSKSFTTTLDNAWVAGNCNVNIFVYKSTGTLNASEIQGAIKNPATLTGIRHENSQVPASYELEQNYPNPFNPTTNIKFAVPKDGNVSLKIYDAIGREVAVYLDGFIKAGYYNAEVDASNFASGVYFYTLYAKDFVQTRKMVLVK